MGLFSFTQEIAMDLGTANTIIISNGKIVVDEPSVVALQNQTNKMIAVGGKAKMMHEKTHPDIRTIRPLQNSVIADFYACEQMIRGLIKMVKDSGAELVACVPAIEKGFQGGGDKLRAEGIRVESLAIIDSMDDEGNITFRN